MANNNEKVVQLLGVVLCVLLLVEKICGYEFVVGGQKGWSVPSDPNFNPYNTWAEKSRFQIGDSLVFKYESGQDSVVEVKSQDYSNCNTNAPISKFSDGHTVIKLIHSGHHFFISGNKDNCVKKEKLVVVVLADRGNNQNSNSTEQASTPTPAPSISPPPASPPSSPPPSATSSPPSPPPGTVEINPTPAPLSDQPPPPPHHNAASSLFFSFPGSLGAYMFSALLLCL